MKILLIIALTIVSVIVNCTAQVSISQDNSLPDPSAGLDVNFIHKGFLPPRMTNIQMMSISSPAEGLMVYNTTLKSIYWFNGITWVSAFQNTQYVDSARVAGLATSVRYNGFTHMQVFDIPGTYTWSLISGECNVMVEIWGGGGGGASLMDEYTTYYRPGAGGGYGKGIWHFSQGTNVIITVGSGGVGSIEGIGGDGGTSSFGNFMYATGGQGGTVFSFDNCRFGGTSNGTINISGQSVCNYWHNRQAGAAPNGGSGGCYFETSQGTGSTAGIHGVSPGGGGGGGWDNLSLLAGNGAPGRVAIYW